jgi:N-acetylmuramoyl-L-alanine amidase
MQKYSKNFLITIFLVVICISNTFGEAVSLNNLITSLEAELEWEPVRDTARIIKGDKWIVFKIGSPYFLLGNDLHQTEEAFIRSENGSILIPEAIAAEIAGFLSVETSLIAEDAPRIAVVLIDPGHGGRDPGAIGEHSGSFTIREKDIVLNVSHRIRDLLMEQYPSKRILLTRNDDTYLTLEERTEMANSIELEENEAIIFISIHANASITSAGHGFEIWYLPPEYEREIIDEESLAPEYLEIKDILNQMLDAEYTLESVLLAKEIELGLEEEVGFLTRNRGLKEEKWFVVRKSKMPSVLIELGFVTNNEEAIRMNDPDYLQRLAVGIYNGIENFIIEYEDTKGFTE